MNYSIDLEPIDSNRAAHLTTGTAFTLCALARHLATDDFGGMDPDTFLETLEGYVVTARAALAEEDRQQAAQAPYQAESQHWAYCGPCDGYVTHAAPAPKAHFQGDGCTISERGSAAEVEWFNDTHSAVQDEFTNLPARCEWADHFGFSCHREGGHAGSHDTDVRCPNCGVFDGFVFDATGRAHCDSCDNGFTYDAAWQAEIADCEPCPDCHVWNERSQADANNDIVCGSCAFQFWIEPREVSLAHARYFTSNDEHGDPLDEDIPCLCHDCSRPIYWDDDGWGWHHAVQADEGCFLIPGEDIPDDLRHPLAHLWYVLEWLS